MTSRAVFQQADEERQNRHILRFSRAIIDDIIIATNKRDERNSVLEVDTV